MSSSAIASADSNRSKFAIERPVAVYKYNEMITLPEMDGHCIAIVDCYFKMSKYPTLAVQSICKFKSAVQYFSRVCIFHVFRRIRYHRKLLSGLKNVCTSNSCKQNNVQRVYTIFPGVFYTAPVYDIMVLNNRRS